MGKKRGSGQASWPCPLVSCPCPAAHVPQSEGSCHLLERKEQKSRDSSLFRHLETQLDFLSTVGSGGQQGKGQRRASKPTSGVTQSTCQHALPARGLSRRDPVTGPEPVPTAGAAHVGSHREPMAERSQQGTTFWPKGYISLPKIPSNALGVHQAPGERGPTWGSSLGSAGCVCASVLV